MAPFKMAPYGAIYYGAYANMAYAPYGAYAIWRIRHMAHAPYGVCAIYFPLSNRARRATQLSPVREKYNCSKSEGKKFALWERWGELSHGAETLCAPALCASLVIWIIPAFRGRSVSCRGGWVVPWGLYPMCCCSAHRVVALLRRHMLWWVSRSCPCDGSLSNCYCGINLFKG